MEYQDIVNEQDEVIEVDSRDHIWERGLEQQTRVVNAFVKTESGKIVMPVRAMTKQKWPGCYDFSCGENVVSKESYQEAIIRGLKEELGIDDLSRLKLLAKFTPKDGVFCFMQVYELVVSDQTDFKFDEHEFSRIELIDEKDFEKLLEDKTKFKRGVPEVWSLVKNL